MKPIDEIKNIYFVGAGGIGMAALERYFLSKGYAVAGYDRTATPLTDALQAEGVAMTIDSDDPADIPEGMRNPADTLVVYTPAVAASHRGLQWFRKEGFDVVKRAQVLGVVTSQSKALCFAGTHGKTTTSSMAAHILHESQVGCNAFLGGVLRNYGTNFLLSATSPYSVIEADEYDRSFHHLHPYIAVITSTDPDHLDIYGTEEAYLESFMEFTRLIEQGGALIVHEGLKLQPAPREGVKIYTYNRTSGDFHGENIRHGNGGITFDFVTPGGVVKDIRLGVPVEINIENSIAAMAAVWLTGEFDDERVRDAMASFKGPQRRFEFRLNEPGLPVVIDDYAHHPDELRMSIASVKALYPDKKLTVAFQPHLYSRTRDFAGEFAEALSAADDVILLDIYPARELPIEGVTSEIIFDKVTAGQKSMTTLDGLAHEVAARDVEVLLTAGAGNIVDRIPEVITQLKESR